MAGYKEKVQREDDVMKTLEKVSWWMFLAVLFIGSAVHSYYYSIDDTLMIIDRAVMSFLFDTLQFMNTILE